MSLSKSNVLFMAAVTGLIVANLYYCQPLIPMIAEEFGVSEASAGTLTYLTQAGYAVGMFLMIPLGDMLERKKQIIITTIFATISLSLMAVVHNFFVLQIISFILGATSIVPQLVLPLAASLSSDEQRGKVIGTVVSGLLIGILFSRTLSGFVGVWLGWRGMFWIATAISVILVIMIQLRLPYNKPNFNGKVIDLYKSLFILIKEQPVLRESTGITALAFAQFGAFWTTMVLLLHNEPFGYDSALIGSFGLIGACGAFAAPLVGKVGGSGGARKLILYGIVLTFLSFAVFYFSSVSVVGLIIGIVLIDLGLQIIHVSNQTRIYSLLPEARNRLNTVYMSFSFLGTAFGSAFGLYLWKFFGWSGVCIGGMCLALLSFIVYLTAKKNI
ncbi:MFS transporter [Myroides marinus]|uniref:MFS transporter n=1 Tax=Myroides marinus TaxID=703342 RepID=A0A161S6R9_9FLAO|nr:MFS transporter [Myroides marinus]KZE75015.1 MFS transporter [Myroides marinus]MDM1368614.1 MFS transporter [Myroides marinus]MDM1375708.1 MFS transporter [Myroides marinus]MDM1381812.1 MFS transporter [Myroides marinus]MDM1388762.1 MFS transporter [Myroides marinus]